MGSSRPRARLALCFGVMLAWMASPGPAHAAGISLFWTDCRVQGGTGALNQNFGCQTNIIQLPLFPGFELTSPVDSVLAMELVIDVDVAAAELPAWWRMDPGQCNEGGWSADTTPSASCTEAWSGLGVANFQGWHAGTPGASARHGRLLVTAVASPGNLVSLEANTLYTACRVLLRSDNVLVPNCEGCSTPACLVFNSLMIRRLLEGGVEQEIVLSEPASPGANQVSWQGGTGADCQSVPARKSTWGAVKAMFR